MSRIECKLSCEIASTFRTEQVRGMFDLPDEAAQNSTLAAEVPSQSDAWQIGAIVGDSGAGKTSIARTAFGDEAMRAPTWDRRRAIIDQLGDKPIEDIQERAFHIVEFLIAQQV